MTEITDDEYAERMAFARKFSNSAERFSVDGDDIVFNMLDDDLANFRKLPVEIARSMLNAMLEAMLEGFQDYVHSETDFRIDNAVESGREVIRHASAVEAREREQAMIDAGPPMSPEELESRLRNGDLSQARGDPTFETAVLLAAQRALAESKGVI